MLADPDDRAIRGVEDAARLFRDGFAGLTREELRVAHLDEAFRPLGFTVASGGRTVDLPLRRIVADALRLDATVMLVAHNHPGGDPTPSRDDREATRRLADIVTPLGIRLLDHLVFAAGDHRSFRALGLL